MNFCGLHYFGRDVKSDIGDLFFKGMNSGPWNHKREFTKSVGNVPLEIKSAEFISPDMWNHLPTADNSWITDILLPTKALYKAEGLFNQLNTIFESHQFNILLILYFTLFNTLSTNSEIILAPHNSNFTIYLFYNGDNLDLEHNILMDILPISSLDLI